MFLTDKEVAALTGYKQASKQIAMLRRQGVPFHVNAAGHPIVASAVFEGAKSAAAPKTWTPSWAATLR
jgi:hypothetical protein